MGKEMLIFAISFFLLFVNGMLLYMGISSGNEIGEISDILTLDSLFNIGQIFLDLPILISAFFVAINITGIAIIIMVIRGI